MAHHPVDAECGPYDRKRGRATPVYASPEKSEPASFAEFVATRPAWEQSLLRHINYIRGR
jgi:hypothetical protein